jgi:hypothetical protein
VSLDPERHLTDEPAPTRQEPTVKPSIFQQPSRDWPKPARVQVSALIDQCDLLQRHIDLCEFQMASAGVPPPVRDKDIREWECEPDLR